MSRVATYLQGHLDGDVSIHRSDRQMMKRDGGVLELEPELVIYPRTTNDIRKTARFGWQLATKGHVLPMVVRGGGSDDTGAALSRGAVIVTEMYMNRLLEFDAKQRLIRLQPGVGTEALQAALRLHGLYLPPLVGEWRGATVGGAIANNTGSHIGKYGRIGEFVEQLEVILSNGDVIQTGRLSRRDVNRKKGQQTFEGELYRALSNLLDDNEQLIHEKIDADIWDGAGYAAITKVRSRDGSMDLTPLFVGSQGSLGIISEAIIKATYYHQPQVAVLVFQSAETARDSLDMFSKLEPASLEYFDGRFIAAAMSQGKKYEWLKNAAALVVVTFDDSSDTNAKRKLKRVTKTFEKIGATVRTSNHEDAASLLALRDLPRYAWHPVTGEAVGTSLFDGVYVPKDRREDFVAAHEAFSTKHRMELPLIIDALTHTFIARPLLDLRKVGDKQKIAKLIDEYATIVDQCGGHLVGRNGEGRLKAAAQRFIEDDVTRLYADVKKIFDPYNMFNTGAKQPLDARGLTTLIKDLR